MVLKDRSITFPEQLVEELLVHHLPVQTWDGPYQVGEIFEGGYISAAVIAKMMTRLFTFLVANSAKALSRLGWALDRREKRARLM